MGKFKRELTYTGDASKLTNIQKKRVSSISQEADATTWLGDDVLGVEVIKYDINGYSVNIKREGNKQCNFAFFNPFPCKCKCIVNNFNPNGTTMTYCTILNSAEFEKSNDNFDIGDSAWSTVFSDATNTKTNVRESLSFFISGFHYFTISNNYGSNIDCTFIFYPISIASYLSDNISLNEDMGGIGLSNVTFVQNRKRFIELLGIKGTKYIRLVNLDAINYVALASGRLNVLYIFVFIVDRNNKELGKTTSSKTIKTFDDLTKVLDGSYGKGTIMMLPFSAKNAALNNYETPTGKPALSYTTFTEDSPEITKLTEIYNSIK
mgnify:CR=1 FL=1